MKTDILCSFRNDAEVSINGSSITSKKYGSDCIVNELEQYIYSLLVNLYEKKLCLIKVLK